MYPDDEMLQMSGLQHFAFCRRQWALIHCEGIWHENLLTTQGKLMHERAHDEKQRERRGDILVLRDLSVVSGQLGLIGKCDVVEFHQSAEGAKLHGETGFWQIYPVEYKRGKPKAHRADEVQLCAQAIALEEMLHCAVLEGALFYGEPHRRQAVSFDEELRELTQQLSDEMHDVMRRGYTPRVKPSKRCASCSLADVCLPSMLRHKTVSSYIHDHIFREDIL